MVIPSYVNQFRPREHFLQDVLKYPFLDFPTGLIHYKPSLVQVMASRWSGDKPVPKQMIPHSTQP